MPALAHGLLQSSGFAASCPRSDPFHKLVEDINKILGPSSGLDSAEINADDLVALMENYISDSRDWRKYAFADTSRNYTRNLVDKGNGKCNLLLIVWTPGKGSPIHDHANAHCVMKILRGSLKETLYSWPDQKKIRSGDVSPPEITRERIYQENEVTYMSDELGLHSVMNAEPDEISVSLHLYTPPHAATFGCSIFDAQTGKASHVKQCEFFSELGHRSK